MGMNQGRASMLSFHIWLYLMAWPMFRIMCGCELWSKVANRSWFCRGCFWKGMKDSHNVSHHIGRGKDTDKIVLVVYHTEAMFLFPGQQLGGVFHACVHVDCECFFGRQFPNRSGYDLAGVYGHFLLIFGVFHIKGKNGSGFFFLDKVKSSYASYQVVRDGVENWSPIESGTKKRDNRLVDRVGSFQSARVGSLKQG